MEEAENSVALCETVPSHTKMPPRLIGRTGSKQRHSVLFWRVSSQISRQEIFAPKLVQFTLSTSSQRISILVPVHRAKIEIFDIFSSFPFDFANSHSEKVRFWGRGRIVLHIFHSKKVFKNEKCFCFLKV